VALGSRREADLDFDPAPVWRRVAQPVLAAWGTADSVVPPRASAEALAGALSAGDNEDRTFSTFSGAGHTLGVAKEGNAPGTAPGFQEQAVDWLHSRLGSKRPVPTVRTPLPPATEAVPVKRVSASLLSSWPVQLLWLLLPAVALVVMGVRALRARGGVDALAEAVDAPLRPWILPAVVVVLDVAALAALAIAVASIVEADGRGVEALAGVPIVILVAWVISLLALAATVVLGRGAWRARRSGEPKPFRLGMTAASASWLLLLAYWLV
jgi:hypothetical protein